MCSGQWLKSSTVNRQSPGIQHETSQNQLVKVLTLGRNCDWGVGLTSPLHVHLSDYEQHYLSS